MSAEHVRQSASTATAKRVGAQLHQIALESVELSVRRLEEVECPPEICAVVMEHLAKLALEMADHYRSKS